MPLPYYVQTPLPFIHLLIRSLTQALGQGLRVGVGVVSTQFCSVGAHGPHPLHLELIMSIYSRGINNQKHLARGIDSS